MRYSFSVSTISLLALIMTSGCSTVTEGVTQRISIDTTPEGATCVLRSNDNVVGIIPSTPAAVQVDKSKYDIIVECSKEGYIKSKIKNHADVAATGIGNMAMLQYSFIGSTIDGMTGASNKYDSHMLIALDVDKDYQLAKVSPQPAAPVVAAPVVATADTTYQAVPVDAVVTQDITKASVTPVTVASTPLPTADVTASVSQQVAINSEVNAQQAVAEILPQVITAQPNLNMVEMTARQPTIEVAQAAGMPMSAEPMNFQPAHDILH